VGTLIKPEGASWNFGAVSTQVLLSGDGGVEFTAEGYSDRIVGFGSDELGPGYEDIDFGFHLTDGGRVFIFEGEDPGSQPLSAQITDYTTGDRFRIAIEAGMVKYYKNETFLRMRTPALAYPLRVHASLYHPGAVVKDAAVWAINSAPTCYVNGTTVQPSCEVCFPVSTSDVDGDTVSLVAGCDWLSGNECCFSGGASGQEFDFTVHIQDSRGATGSCSSHVKWHPDGEACQ
jgi:hypothetical protein